jgi:poly(3-hydroxybutyrate) depolymerase
MVADAAIELDAAPPARVAPEYPGTCPTFVDGRNTGFVSAGLERTFVLELPENPEGAPLLFAWHWLGGSAAQLNNALGFGGLADRENAIVVLPESEGAQFEWRFDRAETNNADLVLFDDLLGCLSEQFSVDLDRVHSTGHSAGGLWTSFLTIHRSEWLASTAVMSGGSDPITYRTPEVAIPVLLIWGGPNDTFRNAINFQETSLFFSEHLREDGHFVAHCVHSGGHTPPPDAANLVWRWLEAHPAGVDEPYVDGLPADYPNICSLP